MKTLTKQTKRAKVGRNRSGGRTPSLPVRAWVGVVAVLALAAAGPKVYDVVNRLANGVKPGVTLEGTPMGGLYEGEAHRRLSQMAEAYFVAPRDAYTDDQGRLQPEVLGRSVDMEDTLARILGASAGAFLRLSYIPVIPAVRTEFFQPFFQGPKDRPFMSLTVNVDWGDDILPKMLEIFRENGVQVTFFITGRFAKKFPDLTRRLGEAGHEIASHGFTHAHPNQLGSAEFRDHVQKNVDLLEEISGQTPRLYAPPYGEWSERTVRLAANLGYRTILWTVDTVDWKRPPASTIVQRVVSRAGKGVIVLMHPTQPTLEALPAMIRGVKEKGLSLVTVSTLLDPPTER